MSKQVKNRQISEIHDSVGDRPAVAVLDIDRLNGVESNQLRRRLNDAGLKMQVVKNTLAARALRETALHEIQQILDGPSAVVYGTNGTSAASSIARILLGEQKQQENLNVRGIIDGEKVYVGKEGVFTVSKQPTRKEAISALVAMILSPAQNLIRSLNAPAAELAALVDGLASRISSSPVYPVKNSEKTQSNIQTASLTAASIVANIPSVVPVESEATQQMVLGTPASGTTVVDIGRMEAPTVHILADSSRSSWTVLCHSIQNAVRTFKQQTGPATPTSDIFDLSSLTLPGLFRFDFRSNDNLALPKWFVDVECNVDPHKRAFSVLWPHSGDLKALWYSAVDLMSQLAALDNASTPSQKFHLRVVLQEQDLDEEVTIDDRDAVWAEIEKNTATDPLHLIALNRSPDEFLIRSADSAGLTENKAGILWSWDTNIPLAFAYELGECIAKTGPAFFRGRSREIGEQIKHLETALKNE